LLQPGVAMGLSKRRLKREVETLRAMMMIACRGRHGATGNLCRDCEDLLAYAKGRLDKCPYQEQKPSCGHCPIHCYKPLMRERIREVMRYAGPRMIRHHPLLAVLHLLDGIKTKKKVKQG